jgi:hypothetical protein
MRYDEAKSKLDQVADVLGNADGEPGYETLKHEVHRIATDWERDYAEGRLSADDFVRLKQDKERLLNQINREEGWGGAASCDDMD